MRDIVNKTTRDIDFDEHLAMIECAKILSKAFKAKIRAITINPESKNPDRVYGVNFAFDMFEIQK